MFRKFLIVLSIPVLYPYYTYDVYVESAEDWDWNKKLFYSFRQAWEEIYHGIKEPQE